MDSKVIIVVGVLTLCRLAFGSMDRFYVSTFADPNCTKSSIQGMSIYPSPSPCIFASIGSCSGYGYATCSEGGKTSWTCGCNIGCSDCDGPTVPVPPACQEFGDGFDTGYFEARCYPKAPDYGNTTYFFEYKDENCTDFIGGKANPVDVCYTVDGLLWGNATYNAATSDITYNAGCYANCTGGCETFVEANNVCVSLSAGSVKYFYAPSANESA